MTVRVLLVRLYILEAWNALLSVFQSSCLQTTKLLQPFGRRFQRSKRKASANSGVSCSALHPFNALQSISRAVRACTSFSGAALETDKRRRAECSELVIIVTCTMYKIIASKKLMPPIERQMQQQNSKMVPSCL